MNTSRTAYQTYQKTQVQTAKPTSLILLLYQGAIDNISAAIRASEEGCTEGVNLGLSKAQEIILELMVSLDPSRDEAFALNLMRLYEYMHHRLIQANVEKDVTGAREIKGMLEELLAVWRDAIAGGGNAQKEDTPVDVQG